MSNELETFATCSCGTCSGHLEFDTAYSGTNINCPHCGAQTQLYVPDESKSPPASRAVSRPASPPPKLARRVSKTIKRPPAISGQIELNPDSGRFIIDQAVRSAESLETTGWGILLLGVMSAFIALGLLIISPPGTSKFSVGTVIAAGGAALIQGFILHQLFKAAAIVIRLLGSLQQTRARGSFTGEMTPGGEDLTVKCSLCSALIQANHKLCPGCGAQLTDNNSTP